MKKDKRESWNLSEPVQPHFTIRPGKGWEVLNLQEVWQFRDLLTTLAARDIKLRYRQTALGILWVILQPLLAAGIFSFVFGSVAKIQGDGTPYFLFSYAGLLGWNIFSGTLTRVSGCLVGNSQLVSKVFFPRLVLPLSSVFASLVDFGVAFAMLIVLLPLYKVAYSLNMLALPFWLLLALLLAEGVGMYVSALMVTYRDMMYVMPVVTQFLLYASPVAYPVSVVLARIPSQWHFFYLLSPLTGLLEGFRWSLLGRGTLTTSSVLYTSVFALLAFIGGAYSFKRMERRFADVI